MEILPTKTKKRTIEQGCKLCGPVSTVNSLGGPLTEFNLGHQEDQGDWGGGVGACARFVTSLLFQSYFGDSFWIHSDLGK